MRGRWKGVAGMIAAATVLALVVAGPVIAATPRLVVHPVSVARGGIVAVSGRGCRAGDLVYLISPPFVGHAFVQHSVATRARSKRSRPLGSPLEPPPISLSKQRHVRSVAGRSREQIIAEVRLTIVPARIGGSRFKYQGPIAYSIAFESVVLQGGAKPLSRPHH